MEGLGLVLPLCAHCNLLLTSLHLPSTLDIFFSHSTSFFFHCLQIVSYLGKRDTAHNSHFCILSKIHTFFSCILSLEISRCYNHTAELVPVSLQLRTIGVALHNPTYSTFTPIGKWVLTRIKCHILRPHTPIHFPH